MSSYSGICIIGRESQYLDAWILGVQYGSGVTLGCEHWCEQVTVDSNGYQRGVWQAWVSPILYKYSDLQGRQ